MDLTDLLMSRGDLLKIRGLTRLLQLVQLQPAIKHRPGVTTTADQKGKHKNIFDYVQDNYVNPIIREHKIVAVVIDGSPKENEGQIALVEEAHLVMTLNPRRDDHRDDLTIPPENIRVSVSTNLPSIPDGELHDITGFVVQQTAAALDRGLTGIPFNDHVGYYHGLLKRFVNAANKPRDRAQQQMDVDEPSPETCAKDLATYIYNVGVGRMHKRFLLGVPLAKLPQDPKARKKNKKRNYYNVVSKSILEIPMHFYESDLPEELSELVPDEKQARFLEQCLRGIGMVDEAHNVKDSKLYDAQGRINFQAVLSGLTANVKQCLSDAHDLQRIGRGVQLSGTDFRARSGRIRDATKHLRTAISRLHRLTKLFKVVLHEHLKWLQCISGAISGKSIVWQLVDSFKEGKDFPPGREGVSPRKSHSSPRKAEITPSKSGRDEVSPQTITADPSTPASSRNFGTDDSVEAAPDDQEAEEDDDELQQLLEAEKEGALHEELATLLVQGAEEPSKWVGGTEKWLKLVCLHESSLRLITSQKRSNYESQLVQSASLSVVQIHEGKLDEATASIDSCLEELAELASKSENPLQVKKLRDVIHEKTKTKHNPDPLSESRRFSGAIHAEATLLGLYACMKDAKISEHLSNADLLRQLGISASLESLKEILKNPLPLITVSKRCCPSCCTLAEVLIDLKIIKPPEGKKKLVTPGDHSTWSAIALPPFIPKAIAEKCLEHLRDKAVEDLRTLQRVLDEVEAEDDSSAASATTRSSTSESYLDDDDEDDDDADAGFHGTPMNQAKVKQLKLSINKTLDLDPSSKDPFVESSASAAAQPGYVPEPSSPLKRKGEDSDSYDEGEKVDKGKRRILEEGS